MYYRSLNKDCAEKLKKISWLIFIIAKGKRFLIYNLNFKLICDSVVRILQRRGDIVEFAYLLVAVLHIVIKYSSNDITCDLIESKITLSNYMIYRFLKRCLIRGSQK